MNDEFELCEMCNLKKASVFIKKNINGNVTEKHLCSNCATHLNKNSLLDDFFDGNLMFGLYGFEPPITQNKIRICKCGATEKDVLSSYKFGCSECYNTFDDLVNSFVKKLGGNTYGAKIAGQNNTQPKVNEDNDKKQPEKIENSHKKLSAKTEKELLLEQLEEAVKNQEFLLANELKTKIKQLDNQKLNDNKLDNN